MAYVDRAQVEGRIPPAVLAAALDDDGDGVEDSGVFDGIVAAASTEVDGYLAGLYTTPFAEPAPAKVRAAAFCFCCEGIFARRNVPYPDWLDRQTKFWREHLEKVARKELPFDAGVDGAFAPGAAVTEDVKINGSMA